MRKHLSKLILFFGLFAFFLASCDMASFNEPQSRNSTQDEIATIQQWYNAQQANATQGTIPQKNSSNAKFTPDWKNATTILTDTKGKKTVSVPLTLNGTETMNNKEMYRRLLADVDANGNIIHGEVVEFMTEKGNVNALKNEKLLAAYKENKLSGFTGYVFQYDMQYKHLSGKRYDKGKFIKENLMLLALPQGVVPPKTKEEAEALARIKQKSKGNNGTKEALDTCMPIFVWVTAYQTYRYTETDWDTNTIRIWWTEEPVEVLTVQYICDSYGGGGGGGGDSGITKPASIPDDVWQSLNEKEKALCTEPRTVGGVSYGVMNVAIICAKVFAESRFAINAAIEYYGNCSEGNFRNCDGFPGNAFQHAVWNASLVQSVGVEWAKLFADAHETQPYPTRDAHAMMDYKNNHEGRQIGFNLPAGSSAIIIKDAIYQAQKNGILQSYACPTKVKPQLQNGIYVCTE